MAESALGRPGAGHVDLLVTRIASDQIHLDREVVFMGAKVGHEEGFQAKDMA